MKCRFSEENQIIKAIFVTFLQTPIGTAYRDSCLTLRNENIYKWKNLCCKYLFM